MFRGKKEGAKQNFKRMRADLFCQSCPALQPSPPLCQTMECSEDLDTADDLPVSWTCPDLDTYELYRSREGEMALPPCLWTPTQAQITPLMRTTLVDWMQEICSEYGLKRSTFHTAVRLVDRHLCLSPIKVLRESYQLVGVAALVVAAKFEEVVFPKLRDFSLAAGNAYSLEQITASEREILLVSHWQVTSPTLYHWTTWLMTQWDDFTTTLCAEYPLFYEKTEAGYCFYRKGMQLVDIAVLDYAHFAYEGRLVSAACLLLALGLTTDTALADFQRFLVETLDLCDLTAVAAAVQYMSQFSAVPQSTAPPKACLKAKSHYYDYLSVQTHVPGASAFVKRKTQRFPSNI